MCALIILLTHIITDIFYCYLRDMPPRWCRGARTRCFGTWEAQDRDMPPRWCRYAPFFFFFFKG